MRLKLVLAPGFLLLICSLPPSALCQTINGVYRGTLGKQEIVVEIGVDPDQPDGLAGRYFYRTHGIAISLKGGQTEDGSFLLIEYHSWKNTGAQWKLKFQDGQAAGTFCKCDPQHAPAGKSLPVQLRRVSSGFNPDFELFLSEPEAGSAPDQAYYNLLLDFPLTTGREVTTGNGYAYVMIEDPRFKTSLPRITRFPDPAAMIKTNQLLDKELGKYRLYAAECLQGVSFNGGDFELKTTVELFNRHLLSVTRQGMIFCGGAHPDSVTYINTYDLDSGSETSVEELLAREMDQQAVRKLIGNRELGSKDLVHRLIAELYLRRAQPDKSCHDVISRNEESHEPAFDTLQYLSSRGLVAQPSLPHVAQACAEPVTIPYEELRTLLRKGSQFLLLVGTAQ
jgi:hypothetical protein